MTTPTTQKKKFFPLEQLAEGLDFRAYGVEKATYVVDGLRAWTRSNNPTPESRTPASLFDYTADKKHVIYLSDNGLPWLTSIESFREMIAGDTNPERRARLQMQLEQLVKILSAPSLQDFLASVQDEPSSVPATPTC